MADRMVTPLEVLGIQEPVTVATSMAINASNANPWPEGVRCARHCCTRCRFFLLHCNSPLCACMLTAYPRRR
jgi:hypothetical protein